jgi:hypothetical protein
MEMGKPMRRAGQLVVAVWLLAALVLLGLDGRLLVLVAWTVPGSLLGLGVRALVRQQRAPSSLDRPSLPARYLAADDLRLPLDVVLAVAESEAETWPRGRI